MEHKIVLGGEQFLPFARSCITKLKKLGLHYADQSFEIDGVSIKVRIEPGHEYIRIEGGALYLPMDSGVVAIGSPFAETISPGVLFEAGKALTYNQKFVLNDPRSVWRTFASKSGQGQISGNLKKSGSRFIGAVPVDGTTARSFTPMNEKVAGSDPAQWVDKPYDEHLLIKEATAFLCPASVFTGRCRLWVQAMYGQYTYEDQKAPNSAERVASKPGAPYLAGDGQPALFVPAYQRQGSSSLTDMLWVGVSTGVYLDKDTGKHWVFALANVVCHVYPLIADAAGEAARRYLVTGQNKELTPEDIENLEAHILSTSRPDLENAQTINHAEVRAWSLGYGWHWNWDGTAADVVVNDLFDQPPEVSIYAFPTAMRSTHWRFSISHTPKAENQEEIWSGTVSTVEGPVDWAIKRSHWVLAEPDWGTRASSKVTPVYTDLFECDAPFYAFYKKNELQVCRVKIGRVAEKTGYRETSPPHVSGPRYADPWYGGGIYRQCVGAIGGFARDIQETGYWAATFSVGGISTAPLPERHQKDSQFSEGVVGGVYTPATEDPYTPSGSTPCAGFKTGYPDVGGHHELTTICSPEGNIYANSWTGPAKHLFITQGHSTIVRVGTAVLIAPINDAEALFVFAQTAVTESSVDREVYDYGVLGLEREAHYYFPILYTPPGSESQIVMGFTEAGHTTYYTASSPTLGGVNLPTPYPSPVSEYTLEDKINSLVSKANIDLTDFYPAPYFWDVLEDAVASSFLALSSTSTAEPIVVSPGHVDSVGIPTGVLAAGNPVIVGWV